LFLQLDGPLQFGNPRFDIFNLDRLGSMVEDAVCGPGRRRMLAQSGPP